MLRVLFSVYVWLLIIVVTLINAPLFVVIWLLTVLFDKKLHILNYFANFWGSEFTVLVPGWKIEVIGKEKLKINNSNIIVANHQSQEDILLMYRLGVPFRWVSKAEVFRIPVYGWLMHLKGDIKLKRSSKSSIIKMMIDSEKVLSKGCSITIFPEGTRSKTNELGKFKEGAFLLAQKAKTSLVPVVIYGTGNKFFSSNFFFKGKHKVTIKILDEIPFKEFEYMETRELANKVREQIKTELDQLKLT
ncbi:MAG: 1-acyl-sn-glycerol-3-phosphate acyltransferase [Bacteroidales bacterium]|nr:1-acyl-sn-glycerol-3-phosphate acyltransferase [Bacteroidales bacterium]